MLPLLFRRLVAAVALGIFLPNAALSSTLHACCMEMSGAHHASEAAGESHDAMAMLDGMAMPADHASHDATAMRDAKPDDDGPASHEGHASHDGQASDAGDPDPSGVCCCLVCYCAASNAGLVSPVATQSLETAATVAAALARYVAVLTSPVSHLRPYSTGPPSTTV